MSRAASPQPEGTVIIGEFGVQYTKLYPGGRKKQPKTADMAACKVIVVMSAEGQPKESRIVVLAENGEKPLFSQLLDGLLMSEQVLSLPLNHLDANQRWGVQLTRLDLPPEDDDDDDEDVEDDWNEKEEGNDGKKREELEMAERREISLYFTTDGQRGSFVAHVGFCLYAAVSTLEEQSFSVERPRPSMKSTLADGDSVNFTVLAALSIPAPKACTTKNVEAMSLVVDAPKVAEERKKLNTILEVTKHSPGSLHSLLVSNGGAAPGQVFITTGRISNEGSWVSSVVDTEQFETTDPVAWALALRFESGQEDKSAALRKRLERQGGQAALPGNSSFGNNNSFGKGSFGAKKSGIAASPSRDSVTATPQQLDAGSAAVHGSIDDIDEDQEEETPAQRAKREKRAKKEKRALEVALVAEPSTSAGGKDIDPETASPEELMKAKLEKKKQKLKDYESKLKSHAEELTREQADLEQRQQEFASKIRGFGIQEESYAQRLAQLDAREQQLTEQSKDLNSKSKRKADRESKMMMMDVMKSEAASNSNNPSMAAPLLMAGNGGGFGDEENYAFKVKYGYYDQTKLPDECYSKYTLSSAYVHAFTRPVVVGMVIALLGISTGSILYSERGRQTGWPAAAFCLLAIINLAICAVKARRYFEKIHIISQVDSTTAVVGAEVTLATSMNYTPLFQHVLTMELCSACFLLLAVAPTIAWAVLPKTFSRDVELTYTIGGLAGMGLGVLSMGAVITFLGITSYTAYERIKHVVPMEDYGALEQRVLMRTAMATYQYLKTIVQKCSAEWQLSCSVMLFSLILIEAYAVYNAALHVSPYREHAILVGLLIFFFTTGVFCFFLGCLSGWGKATTDLCGHVAVHADRWSRGDFGVSKSGPNKNDPVGYQGVTPRELPSVPRPGDPSTPTTADAAPLLAGSSPNDGGSRGRGDSVTVRMYGSSNTGAVPKSSQQTSSQNAKEGRSDVVISDFIYLQQFFAHTVTGSQHVKWYLLWLAPRHGVARWTIIVSRKWLYLLFVLFLVALILIPIAIFYIHGF